MNFNPKFYQRITLHDGSSISVQANAFTYCTPRDDVGPYTHVECGFLQDADGEKLTPPEAHWANYADGEFPSDVYGYVPVDIVCAYLKLHGGIKDGELPPLVVPY